MGVLDERMIDGWNNRSDGAYRWMHTRDWRGFEGCDGMGWIECMYRCKGYIGY